MEPDQEIRVLRLIEYRYETAEAMERDMARWTQQLDTRKSYGRSPGHGVRMSSTHLPPQVVRGLFVTTNDPEPSRPGPRPEGVAVDDLGED